MVVANGRHYGQALQHFTKLMHLAMKYSRTMTVLAIGLNLEHGKVPILMEFPTLMGSDTCPMGFLVRDRMGT